MNSISCVSNFNRFQQPKMLPLAAAAVATGAVAANCAKQKDEHKLTHEERSFLAKMDYFASISKDVFRRNAVRELKGKDERFAYFNIKSGVIPKLYEEGKISNKLLKILFNNATNIISKEDRDYFVKNKIAITNFDNDEIIDTRYKNNVAKPLSIDSAEYNKLKYNVFAQETPKIDKAACERQMILVTGLPAAGKTTVVKNILQDEFDKYYNVDPDTYKAVFEPYYNHGVTSDAVHKASTTVAKAPEIMGRILKEGRNFIRQTSSAGVDLEKIIKDAKNHGYNVRVVHVNVDSDTSKERSISRFKTEGRWLDPARISELTHQSIPYNKVVDTILEHSDVEIYEYDNNGKAPKLLRHYPKRS